jgi:hypothetical protein
MNQIPGDIMINSDAQAAIARLGHIWTGPGLNRALRVIKAVKHH